MTEMKPHNPGPDVENLYIRFGATCQSLHQQLKDQGFAPYVVPHVGGWQNMANAICMLNIHGMITYAETKKARQRLINKISRTLVRAVGGKAKKHAIAKKKKATKRVVFPTDSEVLVIR